MEIKLSIFALAFLTQSPQNKWNSIKFPPKVTKLSLCICGCVCDILFSLFYVIVGVLLRCK